PNVHAATLASAVTATIPDGVANLVLTGAAAINGTGNAFDNVMTGNNAANTLCGLAGADTAEGRGGNDTIIGGDGTDAAVFSGRRSDYAISYNAGTQAFTVVDLRA